MPNVLASLESRARRTVEHEEGEDAALKEGTEAVEKGAYVGVPTDQRRQRGSSVKAVAPGGRARLSESSRSSVFDVSHFLDVLTRGVSVPSVCAPDLKTYEEPEGGVDAEGGSPPRRSAEEFLRPRQETRGLHGGT